MKVLMITGDTRFGPGNPRFELQKSAVDELRAVYWGPPRLGVFGEAGRGALSIPNATGFDVVTSQDPFWRGLVAWIAARRAGARLNIQVHADLNGQSLVKHVLAQIVLRHADSVRVVSETIQQQVRAAAPNARVSVLPVFIDLARFRSITRHSHPDKTILWVGRFEKEKNPLGALQVFKDVHARLPDTKLVMLGAGSEENKLKRAAVGMSVKFPGWGDTGAYLAEADVVLSTSWHESFGASIIEALAAGVPVVAPDVGVAQEAGAIVAPRNELARTVVSVLKERTKGELKMQLLGKEEWQKAWRETL
jgi:glycosyltransferase involved in cell wall biosynthesis